MTQLLHTRYKVLITLTFLIALFFFLQWVNGVIPRYEWKESITVAKDWSPCGEYGDLSSADECYCETIEVVEDNYYHRTSDGACFSYDYEEFDCNIIEEKICYTKEKVRVQ